MKKIFSLLAAAMTLLSANAQNLFLYAYDKAGAENNYIELTTQDGDLYTATGQTFMRIADNGKPHYFFFAIDGMKTEFVFRGKTFRPVPGLNCTKQSLV